MIASVAEYSMAESLISIGIIAAQQEDKVDGDFDDCSSGSDRSFEAEDPDSNSRCDSGSGGHQNNAEGGRSRRRRRHGSHGSRRHKGGSRHKPKGYQPYPSKGDIEMQLKRKSLELQEKENAAAVVRREGADQHIITFPVAPFNSTQFLMDEHSENSPSGQQKTSSSVLNSCSPQDIRPNSVHTTPAELYHETLILEKDKEFTDFFTTAHAESLQSLPKEDLVKHYMNLEEKVAALEKKVAAQQQRQDDDLCSKVARKMWRGCACGTSCNSDANLFSSSRKEFHHLSLTDQSSTSIGESSIPDPGTASSDAPKEVHTS